MDLFSIHTHFFQKMLFLVCLNNASVIFPQDTDTFAPVLEGVSVAILTVLQDEADTSVRDQAVVLEGGIVLHDIANLCMPSTLINQNR